MADLAFASTHFGHRFARSFLVLSTLGLGKTSVRKIRGNFDQHMATFFLTSMGWFIPAPSKIRPEEREFDVDDGPSGHVLSKKAPNSAELDTVGGSTRPATCQCST